MPENRNFKKEPTDQGGKGVESTGPSAGLEKANRPSRDAVITALVGILSVALIVYVAWNGGYLAGQNDALEAYLKNGGRISGISAEASSNSDSDAVIWLRPDGSWDLIVDPEPGRGDEILPDGGVLCKLNRTESSQDPENGDESRKSGGREYLKVPPPGIAIPLNLSDGDFRGDTGEKRWIPGAFPIGAVCDTLVSEFENPPLNGQSPNQIQQPRSPDSFDS